MALFRNKYRIESNRLKNWDYSSNAIYFLTACTNQRACIFGFVENEEMVLNQIGAIVEGEILNSITIRQNWIFHNWKVMPNHIHLLIEINKPIIPKSNYPTKTILPEDTDIELRNLFLSACTEILDQMHDVEMHNVEMHNVEMHDVEMHDVEMHRGASASESSESSKSSESSSKIPSHLSRRPRSISSFFGGFKSTVTVKANQFNNQFEGSIWQANFHDHIVRNYEEYLRIYYYIENNPKKWDNDRFNPQNDKK
jgi:REP element-mobilizing transposase RayT